jgi:dephospho-CoA kinase
MASLNAIVQPTLLDRARVELSRPERGPVLLDAAMLTTWGIEPELDGVVEVRAGEAARVGRLRDARGYTEAEALARVRGQRLPPVRGAKRHWVLDNDGDLAALRREAEAVWNEIAAIP